MKPYNFDTLHDRTATNSVKYDLRRIVFGNEQVIPLWVADMDFATPDFILEAIRDRLHHPILGYTFRSESFAASLSDWVFRQHGTVIGPDAVCFSPGVVPALVFCLLAFTQENDGVIVQTPVYHPFFQVVEQNNRKVVNNPLSFINGKYQIDFDDLEIKAQTAKILFLSNPHNPVGRSWTRDELSKVADICLRHRVLVVSDEIHSDLMLYGHKHVPFASLSKEVTAITITCYAPSKTFNLAGLSSSAVVIENELLRKEFAAVVDRLHLGMGNIAGMVAFEAAYQSGKEWLDQMLVYVGQNFDFLREYLLAFLPHIRLIEPDATYMAWLNFSGTRFTTTELNHWLIHEARVGLNDGAMFGDGGALFQRMNLACPRQILRQALDNMRSSTHLLPIAYDESRPV